MMRSLTLSLSLALALAFPAFADVMIPSGGNSGGGTPGGSSGQYQVNNNGAFAGVTVSGDGTLSSSGALSVTKTGGVSFGPLATVSPGLGVAAALGVDIGLAGAPVLFNGAGGTPSSINLLHATALPATALPALTGDATSSAGSVATTVGAIGGKSVTLGAALTSTGAGATTLAFGASTQTYTFPTVSATLAQLGAQTFTGAQAAPSLALGGATIGTDALGVTGTTTHNGDVTVAGAALILSGNQSKAAWTTNGLRLKGVAGTLTDTTSSGTVAAGYTDVLGGNTIAASSATTFTKYASLHLNAPVAGSNVTITNPLALDVTGDIQASGRLLVGSNAGLIAGGASYFSMGNTSSQSIAIGTNISGLGQSGVVISGTHLLGWASGNPTGSTADLILTRRNTANLQFGNADAAAPVAQTLSVQSVVAGTSNTAGSLWKHVGSLSTGSGLSGDISFQTGGAGAGATAQNTAVDALVIKGATQNIRLPAITTDAGLTDATVCEDTTNHALFFGSGTLGICVGTSSARYKHDVSDLGVGLRAIMALQPKRYFLDSRHGNPNKPYYGFLAEDGADVLPELVGNDNSGRPNTFDYLGIVPILVRAVQEQQAEIETLRRMVQ